MLFEKLSAAEIIDETVDTYSPNHGVYRAYDYRVGSCLYLMHVSDDETRMCAVGRCLTDDALKVAAECEGGVYSLLNFLNDSGLSHASHNLDPYLKPQYRGQPMKFWQDLQTLHDSDYYWNSGEAELARAGKVKEMKERFC